MGCLGPEALVCSLMRHKGKVSTGKAGHGGLPEHLADPVLRLQNRPQSAQPPRWLQSDSGSRQR